MATSSKAPELEASQPSKLPPSKPLQIFLLVALILSGAAYVLDECNQLFAPRHQAPSRIRRLVEARSEYATHLEAGLRAMRTNQNEVALSQFRLALQAQNTAEGCYNLGLILLKLSRPEEAIAQFKAAIALNPRYTEVYLAWSQALLAQGRPDEAAHIDHEALQATPNSSLAHFALAEAALAQEKAARAQWRQAESDGRSDDAVRLEAQIERFQSDALQNLGSAERLGLDRFDVSLDYGLTLCEQKKFAEAEPYLRRVTIEKPDLADAHFAFGKVEDQLKKYPEAISQYEATLALRPDDPPALERLALLYATSSNPDLRSPKMAVQLAVRANDAASQQNARYLDTLARCYAADSNFLQAINWEDKAIHRAEQIHDQELLRELRPRYTQFVDHKTE